MHRCTSVLGRVAPVLVARYALFKGHHSAVAALVTHCGQFSGLHGCTQISLQLAYCPSNFANFVKPLTRAFTEGALARSEHRKLVEYPLAQTGEGIKECEVIQWFVKEGDTVEEFDKLCEVQSDKASVEITSRYSGTILKLRHEPGSIVQVGETLVDIEVCEVDDTHPAGTPEVSTVPTVSVLATPAAAVHTANGTPQEALTLASPAVRRLAREYQLDLSSVAGTGPGGRVLKGDVLALVEVGTRFDSTSQLTAAKPGSATGQHDVHQTAMLPSIPQTVLQSVVSGVPQGADALRGKVVSVPIRGYRRAMVKSMSAACNVPHFHCCDEIDCTRLVEVQQRLKGDPVLGGAKLTFLPFVVKAISTALKQYPDLNSRLSDDSSAVLQYSNHNIGIAIATPAGLVVPNVKGVQDKSLAEVAVELRQLQQSAAVNGLASDAVSGGTITVSNIGSIGGTYATPLINPPEVAIVALGKLQHLPRFDAAGNVHSRAIMAVSWGADHRVVDGAMLASFSNAFKRFLEHPEQLLLHLS